MTLTNPVAPPRPGAATAFSADLDMPARLLRVSGDLDLTTAPTLVDAARMLSDFVRGAITVDLQGVAFCDAAGLNALVVLANEQHERGERLVVHGVHGHLRRTFDVGRAAWLLDATPPGTHPQDR